jgi:hypothetical protein
MLRPKLVLSLALWLWAAVLLPAGTLAAAAPNRSPAAEPNWPKSPVGFVKGYSWGINARRGDFQGKEAEESMKALADTGTQWVTLVYVAHMPAWNKPEILWGDKDPEMVSDADIARAIALARDNKLKVILKPMIDLSSKADPQKPRWAIGFKAGGPDGNKDDAGAWKAWWSNYEAYLVRQARLAQEANCEMFCVGCELKSTERFEAPWRDVIRKTREVYKGPLVYNTMMEGAMWDIRWWDAVDVLGISAYSWRPEANDTSVEAQVAYWTKWRDGLRALAIKTHKPIFFIETGCRSARGASKMSGDFTHWEWPYDGEEQARFYEAILRVFWDEPWFCGYSWWDWKVKLYKKEDAARNKEFVAYGKPAEGVLRAWYAKNRAP